MKTAAAILSLLGRRLTLFVFAGLSACGGGGGGAPNTAGNGVRLALSPTEVALSAGGTVRFVADVQGAEDKRVRFEVVSGPGSVSAEGLYSAPGTLEPAGATASVRVVALADERAFAVATVRLSNGTGGGGGNGGGNNAALEVLAARAGTGMAAQVSEDVQLRLKQSVFWALGAAFMTQQPPPVRTGTMRVVGGRGTYEPTPTDRFVLILESGPTVTFRIATMNGDLSGQGENFIGNDHDLDVRIEIAGTLDLQATSQRSGRITQRVLRGSAILEGNSLAIDLSERDTSSGGGNQIGAQIAVRGSIEGQGIRVQVQDEVRVVVQNVTFFSVETDRTFATTWDVNGTRYELRGGRMSKVFRDLRATEYTFWRAEGTILKDDVPVGMLRGDFEDRFYVVRLLRGDERIELQRIFLNN